MGAFQSGFGMGMQAWQNAEATKERKLARERQDKLDQVTLDAAGRRAELDTIAIEEARRLRDKEGAVRLAGTEMRGVEGFASGAAGQQIFSADKGVAQATADINSAAAELEADPVPGATPGITPANPGATPANGELRAATGVTGGGKPAIAGPGLKFDNSPEGRMKRQAAALRDKGYGEDAQKLETEFAANQSKLYDANRNLLFNNFMNTLQSGGADAAIKLYDHYNDGFTAVHDPNGAGGVVIKKMGDKEVGRLTYKDRDDLALQVKRLIFPDQYLASKEKAASETVTVKPGEEIYQGGVLRYKNSTPTSGEASWARTLAGINGVGGAGSGGSRNGGRSDAPSSSLDVAMDIVNAASKDADGAMKFTPDQMTGAKAILSEVMRRNPGVVSPQVAANVAVAMMRDPAAAKPRLTADGRVARVVRDGVSGQDIEIGDADTKALTKDERSMLSQQAAQLAQELEAEIPQSQGLVQQAAFGDAAAMQRLQASLMNVQQAAVRAAMPKASALQVNERASQLFRQKTLPALQAQLGAIRAYGAPPKAERPAASRTPPVATRPPGVADAPAAPTPASRAAEQRARAQQDADQRAQGATQQTLSAAEAALQSGDPARAADVQSMPGFSSLPLEQKTAIYRLANGLQ